VTGYTLANRKSTPGTALSFFSHSLLPPDLVQDANNEYWTADPPPSEAEFQKVESHFKSPKQLNRKCINEYRDK
jgi:hypothetical protein